MNTNKLLLYLSLASLLILLGCAKAYRVENRFIGSSDDMEAGGKMTGLPDFYYVAPDFNPGRFRKVAIADFTSRPSQPGLLSGMTITKFKTIKADIPDILAQALEGQLFDKVVRIKNRRNPVKAARRIGADAVLLGNLSELRQSLGLALMGAELIAAQFEMKIIDLKTGRTVVKVVDRNKTDADKISMPLVRNLTHLLMQSNRG